MSCVTLDILVEMLTMHRGPKGLGIKFTDASPTNETEYQREERFRARLNRLMSIWKRPWVS